LKKYRGEWIAYNHQEVISHTRDYDKMKEGVAPSLSSLDYVIERIFESEFIEPIRFYPVRILSTPKRSHLLRMLQYIRTPECGR